MLIRIVKLSFHSKNIPAFETLFESVKEKIVQNQGCHQVQLLQDIHNEGVFFTYSYWNSEEDLDLYRNSALFKATWSRTKSLFNDKPKAWSVCLKSEAFFDEAT